MHIPPSMPVVQNLVHWFRPPSSTEISLKHLLRQVKLCVQAFDVSKKFTLFNRDYDDDASKQEILLCMYLKSS